MEAVTPANTRSSLPSGAVCNAPPVPASGPICQPSDTNCKPLKLWVPETETNPGAAENTACCAPHSPDQPDWPSACHCMLPAPQTPEPPRQANRDSGAPAGATRKSTTPVREVSTETWSLECPVGTVSSTRPVPLSVPP
ncbi:hypothetical protein G6F65_016608 [Rhizopus arrhizus]|nr:hypothetical protein G6F65_016608 [Rhizopus arrhizus]